MSKKLTRKTNLCLAAVLCALLAVSSQAATIGAGADITATTLDTAAEARLNIDKQYSAVLPSGTYDVSDFAFKASPDGGGGFVRLFLVRQTSSSPPIYETVWVGQRVAVTADGVVTVTFASGDETLTLSQGTEVFGGVYHDGTARVYCDLSGGATDHDNSPTEPTGVGQSVADFSHANLVRTYAFEINVPVLYASQPDPPDGATGVTAPLLSWQPGDTAMWHDVYLGTDPSPPFKARQPLAWAMWFEAAGWIPGTTYYWRIDEVEADGTTIHTGDVWSFSALSYEAWNPTPADGTEDVWFEDVELSWAAGKDADSHDVYLGRDETAVTDGTGGTFRGNQTDLVFDPGTLELETTYYWRIDEQDNGNVHAGDVWEFTTIKRGPGGAVYRWYAGFGGVLISDLTGNPAFPDNPTGTQLVPDFEGPVDWLDNYGVQMYGWLYPPGTGNYTFWIATDNAGELWLSTDDDPANAVLIASVEGWVPSRDWDGTGGGVPGTNQMSSPVALEAGKIYYIEGLMKEEGGGDNISAAWEGPGIPTRELITGEYVAPTPYPPVRASTPTPIDGAVNAADEPTLEWMPGALATQHDVYLGTDAAAVAAADTTTTGIYRARQVTTSYAPGALEWGETYYWKVNELNLPDIWEGEVWSFTVADFLVVDDFEAYDDFCNRIFYTWLEGAGYFENTECGIVPYVGNGTGSLGGYAQAPYAEQAITHDGSFQSMPFEYVNDGSTAQALYSETERTFDPAQDWTRQGVKALTLYFHGDVGNAAERMYVALEDSAGHVKVVKHPEPEALRRESWQEWNIELKQVSDADVNLQSVKKLFIGVGDRDAPKLGGTGMVYIDDIRLYRPRCVPSLLQPDADLTGDCVIDYLDLEVVVNEWLGTGYQITPVDPGTAGLIAHYELDGNVNDSSARGNHGTIYNPSGGLGPDGSVWDTDPVHGTVASFNGDDTTGAYVDAGMIIPAMTLTNDFTWAFWAKQVGDGTGVNQTILGNRYGASDQSQFSKFTPTNFEYYNNGNNTGFINYDDLPDGVWLHHAVVKDGANLTYYRNGVVSGSSTIDATLVAQPLYMGGDATSERWSGWLSDVRIYERALSSAQIPWLAGKTEPFSEPFDLYEDGAVDFKDYALLADAFLDEVLWP